MRIRCGRATVTGQPTVRKSDPVSLPAPHGQGRVIPKELRRCALLVAVCPVVCGPALGGVPPGVLSRWAGCVVHIPEDFVSLAVALAGAVVAVARLGTCVGRARLEVTERQLPLAGLAAVVSVVAAVLFTTDYALGGAGLPVRTIAMVTLGLYTPRALLKGPGHRAGGPGMSGGVC